MHTPVLLHEAVDGLNVKRHGLYIDTTVGEGGHMLEIAKRGGRVMGIDWDKNQINNLQHVILGRNKVTTPESLLDSGRARSSLARMTLAQGNFSEIEKIAKDNNFFPVDGILFDLGLSIAQIKESRRGFSYEKLNEPLDMRIDASLPVTASDIVNSYSHPQLYEVLARFSEDINSGAIAKALIRTRSLKKVRRVGDLVRVIDQTLGKKDEKTYARIFQALRIMVNNELSNLEKGLEGALKLLKAKGRIVVISYHSLEDRIVKQFIKYKLLKQIEKKPIKYRNLRFFERSARLRIIEN